MCSLAPELKQTIINRPNHGPCPVHGGKDGLRAFNDFDETGGVICNTCGAFSDGFKTLMWINNWSEFETIHAVRKALDYLTDLPDCIQRVENHLSSPSNVSVIERQKDLQKLFNEGLPTNSTEAELAATYYKKRGLLLPPHLANVRFIPALKYWERGKSVDLPAIIARVDDVKGNLVSVHRTYLSHQGEKALVATPKKLMSATYRGATKGAAIRLFQAEEEVALAEGIETALAVHQAQKLPVWSTISAWGMAHVQLPPAIKRVSIWADKDLNGVGQNAAKKLAARLVAEGRTVKILIPEDAIPPGKKSIDWLDILNKPDELCL